MYVYCSNESNVDVFFDNLQLVHTREPLLQTANYYPFGLTMSGISSKAAEVLENNKQKFQGQELASKEFSDGSGLEMYEFKWRMDDPQTGRFWQVDPLADKYVYNSPYAFSENKVTGHVELEGLESVNFNHVDALVRAAYKENVMKPARKFDQNLSGTASVKGTVGVGVGHKFKVLNIIDGEAGASLFNAQISATSGGQLSFNGEVGSAGLSFSTEVRGTQIGEYKVGGVAGAIEIKDGKFSPDVLSLGQKFDSDLSVSKEVMDKDNKKASAKASANSSGEIIFGGQLGIAGVEVMINVVKGGKAVVNAFEAVGNWLSNVTKEISNQSFNVHRQK